MVKLANPRGAQASYNMYLNDTIFMTYSMKKNTSDTWDDRICVPVDIGLKRLGVVDQGARARPRIVVGHDTATCLDAHVNTIYGAMLCLLEKCIHIADLVCSLKLPCYVFRRGYNNLK